MNEATNKIIIALENVQGSATYDSYPSKETLEAVNRMAEKAYNSDFLSTIKKTRLSQEMEDFKNKTPEATKELTLADFQQQVADKKGFKDWHSLYTACGLDYLQKRLLESAESYAQYRYEQGKQEGETTIVSLLSFDQPWPLQDVITELTRASKILLQKHSYDGQRHEEILAACNAGERSLQLINYYVSIINGLKQEEE